MLIYKIFDYISFKVLRPFEIFIRSLNAALLQEPNTKLIASSDSIEKMLDNSFAKDDEEAYEDKNLVEVKLDPHVDQSVCGEGYNGENNINQTFGFEYNLKDYKYYGLIGPVYNNVHIQNILAAISLLSFTVILGSLLFLVVEYLVPKKFLPSKTNSECNTTNDIRYNEKCELLLADSTNTYISHPSFLANTRMNAHFEAKAHITDSFSKNISDILNNNPPFFSYDFIIDEYMSDDVMSNGNNLGLEYTSWDSSNHVSSSNQIKMKSKDLIEDESASSGIFKEPIETSLHHNITHLEYICPYLANSSLKSFDSSSPQTLQSDIQNNSILTDDDFEKGQQCCLQNLLNLYNETHSNTISCFPIKTQTEFNSVDIFDGRNKKAKRAPQESIPPELTTDADFNESDYIASYARLDKPKIKSFTKLSRAKYSPLYSVPKFELSPTTAALISNQEQDPLIFFDLYDYLSLLEINDRLNSIEILSHEYDDDISQVSQLIEFEISNLCFTANEFEMQDTVKKLQYIISTKYDGKNPNISKIIQMYNNSLKEHMRELIDLLKTPSAQIIVLLLCDYLSFADNNKIDIETYNCCLEAIFESVESNTDFCKIISNSACIIVCALDFKMLRYTFIVIFDHIFRDEKIKTNQQIAALKCLKYYICFNRSNIINELTANPMENKVKCCGYQLVDLLASNILKIIRLSQKSKIPKKRNQSSKYHKIPSMNENSSPIILELIDTYLVIVEVFLNNEEIPSSIQYELLSSFITKIYTQLRPVVECDLRILDPPILKELQIHFDLPNSQLR